jgi:UDP-4-amino-4-deoxy-L-arabinose-oxoglutarate aminotransferase
VKHAWHLFAVWIEGGRRDLVLAKLQERGIGVVVNYRAIHLLTYFRETLLGRPGQFPAAEAIGDATLSLPLFPGMTDAELDEVVEALRALLG